MAHQPTLPQLRIQKSSAREQLQARIAEGHKFENDISAGAIANNANLDDFCRRLDAWRAFNELLLRRLFTTDEFAGDYQASVRAVRSAIDRYTDPSLGELVQRLRESVKSQISRLRSIDTRLDLLDECDPNPKNDGTTSASTEFEKAIFVVHGHDKAALFEMTTFLGKAGFRPIVLNEAPGGALTIIEKLEHHSHVGFVVVLLTPDDIGGAKAAGADALHPRARQNVIGELFFFAGKFGRERIAVFKKGEIEFPTDIVGIGWHELDDYGGWKRNLLRELAQAGFEIDKNAVLA